MTGLGCPVARAPRACSAWVCPSRNCWCSRAVCACRASNAAIGSSADKAGTPGNGAGAGEGIGRWVMTGTVAGLGVGEGAGTAGATRGRSTGAGLRFAPQIRVRSVGLPSAGSSGTSGSQTCRSTGCPHAARAASAQARSRRPERFPADASIAQVCARSPAIAATSPDNRRPGPISMNVSMPSASIASMQPTNSTGAAICRASVARISVSVPEYGAPETFANTGRSGSAKRTKLSDSANGA